MFSQDAGQRILAGRDQRKEAVSHELGQRLRCPLRPLREIAIFFFRARLAGPGAPGDTRCVRLALYAVFNRHGNDDTAAEKLMQCQSAQDPSLWRNPGVEGSLDLVDLAKFSVREWRNAVLFAEDPQLVLGVDAPLLGAGFAERGLGGLVLAKEDRLPERF